jgi:DNA repair photolyase
VIRRAAARSILSPTSGFIAEAGFTHSVTPARNCTFGCTYCYVPTLGVYGGLKPEDWRRWGQFTTFKTNAAELLRRELIDDPMHVRAVKRHGATTREAAWHDPVYQDEIVKRIQGVASCTVGPPGFARLSR